MQAKLVAAYGCFLVGAVLTIGSAAPSVCAQSSIETQQQANDRIRTLSANASANTAAAPAREYIIGKGDLVGVEVYDVPELTRDLRVSQTGTIGLPLLPVRLYLVGLTETQAQQKIAEVLAANGLVTNPRVMISVKEKRSKPITIVGAVARPQVYQADRPITLVQLLAEAGGIATDAGDTVIIIRGGDTQNATSSEPPEIGAEDAVPATNPGTSESKVSAPDATVAPNNDGVANGSPTGSPSPAFPGPEIVMQAAPQNTTAAPPVITTSDVAPLAANTITVNLAELLERGDTQNNIQLQGGDIITVPHSGIVYALGAVQRPGGFVANNDRAQLSTLKVLALAGGMTRIAKKDHAVIIRKDSTGKQQEIPVDLAKIVQRKSEDVRMMPSDILYIPDNTTKAVLIRASEIALAMGTALTIYRLGSGN
jgi:protein involved in polysaccharide export with SLBB domain